MFNKINRWLWIFLLWTKREQCDKDKDVLKEATGEGVEEKIGWKGIQENMILSWWLKINKQLSLCS